MNITDTVNKLLKKATELRQQADHIEEIANELVIVADENFGENSGSSSWDKTAVSLSRMGKFQKLGKTPLNQLPDEAYEMIPSERDIIRVNGKKGKKNKVTNPLGRTPAGRIIRYLRCKQCGTSVKNIDMGNHLRYSCPVVNHERRGGKVKKTGSLHWMQKPENRKKVMAHMKRMQRAA